MENTVNERVLVLKKELGLTDIQFCGRANISTATLNKIRNNEQTTQKINNLIRKTFGMIKLNEGLSIESVSKMMGHNSIVITQKTYAKVTHIRIQNEINNLGLR